MRHIVFHPAAVLRRRAEPVETISDGTRVLVEEMFRIMREERGLGLAAPQVGASLRIFVTAESEEHREVERVFINPRFALVDGLLEEAEEGCLSLPDIHGSVRRQPHVIVEALDLTGTPFSLEGSGLMARCWQHEMDHLDGILIIDRMSVIDRIVNRKRLRLLESAGGEARERARDQAGEKD